MNGSITFDELKTYAGSLAVPQRGELASFLLASLHAGQEGPDPQFRAVLARRIEELRSGKVKGIPAKDAFASLDE
jgi:hypothetical protein